MAEFDKTKKAIGVGGMDDKSRADMFKKFQTAGGQVVKEKTAAEKAAAASSRPAPTVRQGTPTSRGGSSGSGSGTGGRSSEKEKTAASEIKLNPKELQRQQEAEMGNFLNKLIMKFKCWSARVTSFGSSDILPAFMSEFNLEGKRALMEFNMVGNDLFGNPETGGKITKELDKISPLYVELLARGHKIYDGREIVEFLESYIASPDLPVSIHKVAGPGYSIFKKLYYLYPFMSTYRKAVNAGYDALQRIEGKPALIYATKKKKINSEINVLFGTIFDKLYLIVCRKEEKNIPLLSSTMENILGIIPEDKPGIRKSGEDIPVSAGGIVEEEASDEKTEEKKEEESESKEFNYGMRLMKMYTIEKIRRKHDPKNEMMDLADNDKALLSYVYFKEFLYEYSFVLTTKKIDLKASHVNGAKVDHRLKLQDIYEMDRPCEEQFKIYKDVVRELAKHKQNPGSNYIQASKKTTELEQKRSQQARNSRNVIKEFMEKTRDGLAILISDMKSKKEIVGNMDEIMTFDSLEVKKRMNKKPIKQCIMEAYCYSLAFADRLTDGDLFGGIVDMSPEEMQSSFGIEVPNPEDQPKDDSGVNVPEGPGLDTLSAEPEENSGELNI